jgi:hypothetical protein
LDAFNPAVLLTKPALRGQTDQTVPHRVIHLHAAAPPKPPPGQACNGCGVCCTAAPCPLGMLLSRRRTGACVALQWQDGARQYRCGLLADPRRWLPALPAAWARGLARRWIAAGQGCDSDLQASPAAVADPSANG